MKAKIGAIFLISMLALAGTGAAYALWYEDLYIITDIYTGDVDVEWSVIGYRDTETKEVSTGGMQILADNPNILHCWIKNAYPCIDYYFDFDLHCVGSIPVHFNGMYVLGGSLLLDYIEWHELFIDRIEWADGSVTSYNPPIAIGTIQLHQGDVAYGHYLIHFNNNLPEDSFFDIILGTTAYQYNEGPPGPPPLPS
jgi:hypothetical protein